MQISSHLPSYLNSWSVCIYNEASKSFTCWTFGIWVGTGQKEVPEKKEKRNLRVFMWELKKKCKYYLFFVKVA